MQDEINEKTIALYIKTGKLTAQTLQKAMKTLLAQMKKQKDKTPQGKQRYQLSRLCRKLPCQIYKGRKLDFPNI